MARVSFKNVTKSFGEVQVIPPLNLDIDDGEFVVLVGPSGSGKTTTLRMLAGLETVTSGAVHSNDQDITELRPGARNFAMVFQNYALYPHMSVYDNIAYGMKVRKTEPIEIDKRVTEAAGLLGLTEFLQRKPKNLSGGQRQRVAIGRAIVRQPDVFLFDEPLSNLDAKLRVEMRAEIRGLQRRLGTTAVYVTHDQVEAMTMADRVVVMNYGKVEQADHPIELYERPANRFVANFIGSPAMNFFDGEVENGHIMLGSERLKLSDDDAKRLGADRRKVIFGIRPEHMRKSKGNDTLTMIPSTLEPLGPHTLVIGQVGAVRSVAQVGAHDPIEIGAEAKIPIDMNFAHFFDSETEQRL